MCAEERNQNVILSQIIADLFASSRNGDDLQAKILLLRGEINKVIDSEDTIFGKFRGLVESFREIIPDEKQRYNAAIKALSTTVKLSRQDIVRAVSNQLAELKVLEKGLMGTSSGWRDDLRVMEAKSREIKDEISRLRERIGQLEIEEKAILNSMATRGKDVDLVSRAVGQLFAEITAEITYINKKVAEVDAESAPSQPVPPRAPVKSDVPVQEKVSVEPKSESPVPSAPQYADLQKKCPLCGGRMVFYSNERMWRCFSCAHEELQEEKGSVEPQSVEQGSVEQKIEIPEPAAPQYADSQKKCPMCGGRMDFYGGENKWRCFSCAFEELKEERRVFEQKIEIPEPIEPQSTEFQKKCSMCGGRMDFYSGENKWICFVCAFEESANGEVQDKEVQDKSEENNKHTRAPEFTSVSDPVFDPSKPSHHQPPTKKKPCPVCHKKMNWAQEARTWRCPYCHYMRKA